MLWIRSQSTSTIGGNADINIHANNPDIEFRELDTYTGSNGTGQWEIAVNFDNLQINPRNTANTAFQTMIAFDRDTGMKFKEMDGNDDYVAFRASTTLPGASYTYVLPSSGPASGQVLGYTTTSGTDYNTGWVTPAGSGASGVINATSQNYVPYYSVSGSSNVLSGSPGISVTTITASGSVTIASSVTLEGSGAGVLDLIEGAQSTAGPPAASHAILWADSSSHTLVFNPNNTSTYTVVGSSKSPVAGNVPVWSGQGSLIDSGFTAGVSGITSPGTFTWVNSGHGVLISTVVVSSNTVLQGATWYHNFPPKIGGNLGSTSAMYINGGNASATGPSNVMIGDPSTRNTGDNLTTGNSLSCFGSQSCGGVVTANNTVAVGDSALLVSSAGANNTVVGSFGMYQSTQGSQNVCIGRACLQTLVNGSNNIAIGFQSCNNTMTSSTTITGSMCLGYAGYVDSNNTASIGSPTVPYTDVFMNSKYHTTNNTAGSSTTFHAQASSGTDRAGGSLGLAGGQGTGTGAGSTVDIWVSSPSVTSNAYQASTMTARFAWPGVAPVVLPAATIQTIAPKFAGQIVGCSDCTLITICVSTGTATGAWASPISRVTACL
jgi:hypothetical protein